MSSSLVKKSLQLFDDGDVSESSTSMAEKKKQETTDPMKLISTRKKGVKKELQKLKKEKNFKQNANPKIKTSAIEMHLSQLPTDQTESSLQMLKKLSRAGKTDASVSKLILEHNGKKFPRYRRRRRKRQPQPEQSVFTEKDFAKFEQEYDF